MGFSWKPKVPAADYSSWAVGLVIVAAAFWLLLVLFQQLLIQAPYLALVLGMPFLAFAGITSAKSEQAFDGTLLWDPPSVIQIGHPKRVEVLISGRDTEVAKLLAQFRGSPTVPSMIPIRPALSVCLIEDSAFKVSEQSNRDQYLEPGQIARWYFEVDGKQSGWFPLRLRVSLRRQASGKEEATDLEPLAYPVRIRESLLVVIGRFAKKHKISAAVLAAGAWLLESSGLLDRAAALIRNLFS